MRIDSSDITVYPETPYHLSYTVVLEMGVPVSNLCCEFSSKTLKPEDCRKIRTMLANAYGVSYEDVMPTTKYLEVLVSDLSKRIENYDKIRPGDLDSEHPVMEEYAFEIKSGLIDELEEAKTHLGLTMPNDFDEEVP